DRPAGASRNTGQGPDVIDVDLRLAYQLKAGEKARLQFIAEAFNLANRANFASVNNVVGSSCRECQTVGATFVQSGIVPNPSANTFIRPNDGLAFTSAQSSRQLQFGFRLAF